MRVEPIQSIMLRKYEMRRVTPTFSDVLADVQKKAVHSVIPAKAGIL